MSQARSIRARWLHLRREKWEAWNTSELTAFNLSVMKTGLSSSDVVPALVQGSQCLMADGGCM